MLLKLRLTQGKRTKTLKPKIFQRLRVAQFTKRNYANC